MSRQILAVLLLTTACHRGETGSATIPNPVPSIEAMCRCRLGPSEFLPSLAIIRVIDDPVPYRAEAPGAPHIWESGLEFTVAVEQMTALNSNSSLVPPPQFRGRTVTRYPGGPVTQAVLPMRGARGLSFVGPAAYQQGLPIQQWAVGLIAIDQATNTLAAAVYQFPAGTSVSQFLDPVEWGNPTRGCVGCSLPNQPVEAGVAYDAVAGDAMSTDATVTDIGRD